MEEEEEEAEDSEEGIEAKWSVEEQEEEEEAASVASRLAAASAGEVAEVVITEKADFQMVVALEEEEEAAEAADFLEVEGEEEEIWSDRINNPFSDRHHLDYRLLTDHWPMEGARKEEEVVEEEEEEGTRPRCCRRPVLSLMPTALEVGVEAVATAEAAAAALTGWLDHHFVIFCYFGLLLSCLLFLNCLDFFLFCLSHMYIYQIYSRCRM